MKAYVSIHTHRQKVALKPCTLVGRRKYWVHPLGKYLFQYLASFPGSFEKSEKRVCYPLFADALNFLTSREVQILSCHLCVLWHQERVYCRIFNHILFAITTCMHNLFCTPSIDFAVKRWCSNPNRKHL